jgi:hypothetical protein
MRLRKTETIVGFMALSLIGGAAQADDGWANFQAGYDAGAMHATARVEGGVQLTPRLNLYGFSDFEATPERRFEFDVFYSELRAHLGEGTLRASAEVVTGTGLHDFVRFGATYTPNFGENNFTQFRFYPWSTKGWDGAQASAYIEQQIGRVGIATLLDYDFAAGTAYFEPELNFRLSEDMRFYLRARSFGPAEEVAKNLDPVVGVRINLK